jgi:hypothetical protein
VFALDHLLALCEIDLCYIVEFRKLIFEISIVMAAMRNGSCDEME